MAAAILNLMAGLAGASGLLALGLFGPVDPPPDAAGLAAAFPPGPEFQYDPPVPGSYALPPIKPAPGGQVLDGQGQPRDLAALLDGRLSLVSFVYFSCGDTEGCPLAMSVLYDIFYASADLPALRDRVQLVTISFDPARDTPEAVASFAYPITSAGAGHMRWQVLTTRGQDELQPILAGYGQSVDPSPDGDEISHVLRMYLVDAAGQVRNVYGLGTIDPRLIMTDVETLLLEEG